MGEELKNIMQEIYNHQMDGVIFHSSLVYMYDFLRLRGMKKWQKRQLEEETKCFHKVQHHFIKHYHMLLKPDAPEKLNSAIPDAWYSVDSMDLSADDIRKELKKSLDIILDWEEKTCKFLREKSKSLIELDAFDEYMLVKEMMSHVAAEINYVQNLVMELESVNYDAVYIRRLQERFCTEFDD